MVQLGNSFHWWQIFVYIHLTKFSYFTIYVNYYFIRCLQRIQYIRVFIEPIRVYSVLIFQIKSVSMEPICVYSVFIFQIKPKKYIYI